MYRTTRQLLTPEQRKGLTQIPKNTEEWELGAHYTLTEHDLQLIHQRRRDAITEAIKVIKEIRDFDEDLIHHISPLGWEHINLLGEYSFDLENRTKPLRTLNI